MHACMAPYLLVNPLCSLDSALLRELAAADRGTEIALQDWGVAWNVRWLRRGLCSAVRRGWGTREKCSWKRKNKLHV